MDDSFLDEDERFRGFTDQEWDAIHQALIEKHLKPEFDWKLKPDNWQRQRIPFEITTLMQNVSVGKTVLSAGKNRDQLKAVETKVDAALQACDQLVDPLQWHVNDQCEMVEFEGIEEEWAALISKETGQHICPTPMTHRCTVRQLLDAALSAVRLAAERPVNPMIASVQEKGRRKNNAIRLAVWELLEIFELATGIRPKVSSNSHTDDGITGNVCAFLLACLAPVNLVPRTSLGRNILEAYREWNRERMRHEQGTCHEHEQSLE